MKERNNKMKDGGLSDDIVSRCVGVLLVQLVRRRLSAS